MIFSFVFYGRPFSINRWTYATRKTKTAEARLWETQFLQQIKTRERHLKTMADKWRKDGGYFTCTFHTTYVDFLNSEGTVSSKTIDVTNFEKILQDVLFNIMGLNDKVVLQCTSTKSQSNSDMVIVVLELHSDDPSNFQPAVYVQP